jgi:hypothetical protein
VWNNISGHGIAISLLPNQMNETMRGLADSLRFELPFNIWCGTCGVSCRTPTQSYSITADQTPHEIRPDLSHISAQEYDTMPRRKKSETTIPHLSLASGANAIYAQDGLNYGRTQR